MGDPQTARFIAKYYYALKGLVLVPSGAMLTFMGVGQLFDWPGFRQGDLTLFTILAPIVVVLTIAAVRYYRRRFGEVRRQTSPGSRALAVLFGVLVVGVWWLASVLDELWLKAVPVGFGMLVLAVVFGLTPVFSEGRRRYYFAIGGAIVILALLPVTGVYPNTWLGVGHGTMNAAIGMGLLVGGLLDHWMLAEALRVPGEASL